MGGGLNLVRIAMGAAHQLRRALWFFTRPHTRGVHAVPLTPAGEVVLVRLTYLRGWHLPGGKANRGEADEAAVLRELREEIGLRGWSRCAIADRFEHRIDWKHDRVTLFLLTGVDHAPRRSLEIAEVAAFALDRLPARLSETERGWIRTALALLTPDAAPSDP
ncbi:NUDIX domain-containing protein [Sphingomonas sp.]|uniref:NUDIX domain-containing protein n=1 Tax=Sphingomonas sp. TaxID=28214 RepID=UPI001ED399D9|nr:NUDIX domain-containing protein [Sphingomonas sp.]MBX3593902.1 NUDIX domain-containing protein [Sphingomonas sp.]